MKNNSPEKIHSPRYNDDVVQRYMAAKEADIHALVQSIVDNHPAVDRGTLTLSGNPPEYHIIFTGRTEFALGDIRKGKTHGLLNIVTDGLSSLPLKIVRYPLGLTIDNTKGPPIFEARIVLRPYRENFHESKGGNFVRDQETWHLVPRQ